MTASAVTGTAADLPRAEITVPAGPGVDMISSRG